MVGKYDYAKGSHELPVWCPSQQGLYTQHHTGEADEGVMLPLDRTNAPAASVNWPVRRAEGIAEKILSVRRIDLRDAARSAEGRMRAIVEGLGQAGSQGQSRPRILNDPQGAAHIIKCVHCKRAPRIKTWNADFADGADKS